MYSTCYRWKFVLFVLLCCWLATGTSSKLYAQMTAVVNSTADDMLTYPWDDPDTPDIDESVDGICEDLAHRCTLRAALFEASFIGIPVHVTFSVNGIIHIDTTLGAFMPPPYSIIQCVDQNVTIKGAGTYSLLMAVDSMTAKIEFLKLPLRVSILFTTYTIGGILL